MSASLEKVYLLYGQRRFDAAIQAIVFQLSKDPQNAILHSLWGMCLSELKQYREAEAKSREAVALGPDLAQTHHARSYVLFRDAIRFGAIQRNRKLGESLESIEQAIALSPMDADCHFQKAVLLAALDRQADAQPSLKMALNLDPHHAKAMVMTAEFQVKEGRDAEAIQLARQALAAEPENYEAHLCVGNILLKRGEVEQAKEHLQEALRLEPNSTRARLAMIEAIQSESKLYRWLILPQKKWFNLPQVRRTQIAATVTIGLLILLIGAILFQQPFLIATLLGIVAVSMIGWFASKLAMDASFQMKASRSGDWKFVNEEERKEWQFALVTLTFVVVGGLVWGLSSYHLSVAAGASVAFFLVPLVTGRVLDSPGMKAIARSSAALTASCGLGALACSFWFPSGAVFLMILSATLAGISSLTIFAAASRRV